MWPIASRPAYDIDGYTLRTLSWNQGAGRTVLFVNQSATIGATLAGFGTSGPVTFTFENTTQNHAFTISTAVAGIQQFQGSLNYADFGVGPLSTAAAAVAAAGPGGVFLGVEDRQNGDNDFNDFNDFIYYTIQTGLLPPPNIAYNPTAGSTVGFDGVTTIGTTGNGSIEATPSGGRDGGATTTIDTCTRGGANPGSFAGAAAVNLSFVGDTTTPQNLNLTCTSQQTAQTSTLTCNDTRGAAAPAQRQWPLSCPAGTLAPTTSTPVSGSTVNLTGVAGGININTSTTTVSNPNPVVVSLTCTAPAFPFTATPLAFSFPAGGNAAVTIGISPAAAAGTYSGTRTCNVNGSSQMLTFNLAGTLTPVVMVPATSLWSLLALMLALVGFAAVAARRQG